MITDDRSETDLESLASYSTIGSSSSHFTNPSSHRQTYTSSPDGTRKGVATSRVSSFSSSPLGTSALGLRLEGRPIMRQRALSNTSSIASKSHSLAPLPEQPDNSTQDDLRPNGHNDMLSPPFTSSRMRSSSAFDRREKRRQRKEERAKKSTLRGERYDSPLRRIIRWLSAKELSHWGLVLCLVVVGLIRLGAEWVGKREGLALERGVNNGLSSGTSGSPLNFLPLAPYWKYAK